MSITRRHVKVDRRTLAKSGLAGVAGPTLYRSVVEPVARQQGAVAAAALQAQGLPDGTALATSVRLPLVGIGSSQIAALLDGSVTDWQAVGSPVSLPVTVVGIDAHPIAGLAPATTVATYEAFVALLAETPGAVAVVPLDRVTLDVSVLAIDGASPLLGAGTAEAPVVRIGFGGDILFGRTVGERNRRYDDYIFPLLALKDLFASFDLAIANWECFISETIDIEAADRLDFVTLPAATEAVTVSRIDAVSMANNHAFFSHGNYGPPAYFDTAGYLDAAGIRHFGAGANLDEARQAFTTEANGLRIAVYGVDGVTANIDYPDTWGWDQTSATDIAPGTNPLVMANIEQDIQRLAAENDIVIPFFHMGEQYIWNPERFAVEVTRACIDAGASAVITSHPHTIQGMDIYKGRPIFHGLGNLVYDQMFSVDTRTGYIVELTFKGSEVIGFRLHGFENFDFCQARLMAAGEHAALMNRFWRSTDLTRGLYPVE